jgi:dienelactone hydrolase
MKTRLLLIALSSLVLASCAGVPRPTKAAASPLPPTGDYSGLGPFKTISENNTGPDGTYTIVRPETLRKDGFLHAPIIFGPGIGGSVESMMNLLQRIASHGFVIIGRQLDGGPNNPENNRRMIAGLDWLIEQNTKAGSPFQGKLDVTHAASMGYSVGGTGAVDIGGHKAITTVVSIHGHSAKADLHGTLLLIGGSNDVMRDGQSWLAPTYAASQVQTFFSLVDGANHGYPSRTVDGVQSGVEAPAMIAWLRYWIYNDQGAKRYFFGEDCVMCKAPWTKTQRKNWP